MNIVLDLRAIYGHFAGTPFIQHHLATFKREARLQSFRSTPPRLDPSTFRVMFQLNNNNGNNSAGAPIFVQPLSWNPAVFFSRKFNTLLKDFKVDFRIFSFDIEVLEIIITYCITKMFV